MRATALAGCSARACALMNVLREGDAGLRSNGDEDAAGGNAAFDSVTPGAGIFCCTRGGLPRAMGASSRTRPRFLSLVAAADVDTSKASDNDAWPDVS